MPAGAPATYPHTKTREGIKGRQMANEDNTKDPAAKRAAIALLAKGLVNKSEAADLAGVSRQLVQHWARDIPLDKARNAVLSKLWRKEIARK